MGSMFLRAVAVIFLLLPTVTFADLTIFDVRKNLPMSEAEPVYRDFIINGGSEAGLSVGMVLTVQRRLPLYDSYQNRSAGDLSLKVAKVKIIHVQRGLAVARLHSEFTREATPLLEDNFIMVGDHVDLGSASSDKGAAAETPAPAPVAEATPEAASVKAEIVVNSVELSSETPKPAKEPPPQAPTPGQKLDIPTLQ
jgi:hypothetical protein